LQENTNRRGLESTIELVKGQLKSLEKALGLQATKTRQIEGQLNRYFQALKNREIIAAHAETTQRIAAQARAEEAAARRAFELEQLSRRQGAVGAPIAIKGNIAYFPDQNGKLVAIELPEGAVPVGKLQPRPAPRTPAPKTGVQDGRLVRLPDPSKLPEANVGTDASPVLSPAAAARAAKGEGKAQTLSGSGGAVQFRYNATMVNAGNLLAIEIENAADLPRRAAPPGLAEVLTDPSKGLTEAGKRYLSQKITEPESRAMQQVFAGMQRAMTTIETSGRPSGATEAAIKEFGKTLPRAGDNKINTYLFLAQGRQVMEILEKDLKASGASEEQIKQAVEARKSVEKVINWTVKDVNRILSAGGARLVDEGVRSALGTSQTLNEFGTALRQKSSDGASSSVPRGDGIPETRLAERMDRAGATPGVSVADIREKAQKSILQISERTDIDSKQKGELTIQVRNLYKEKTGMDL
jgi:hypothetical protein